MRNKLWEKSQKDSNLGYGIWHCPLVLVQLTREVLEMSLSTEEIKEKQETFIRKFNELLESTEELDSECSFMFEKLKDIKKQDIPDPGLKATQRCFLIISDINASLMDFLAEAHNIILNENEE